MRRMRASKKVEDIRLRLATPADTSELRLLIAASVRELQASDYTPDQLEAALKSVYGVDTQLIADGTYWVAERLSQPGSNQGSPVIVGCGGWSKRKTLYGGDQWTRREDALLDPASDAAKIRAFFIHPDWARCGIGSMILEACESAAQAAGFTRLEMGATLTGVPFYRSKGYVVEEETLVPMERGLSLPILRMKKQL